MNAEPQNNPSPMTIILGGVTFEAALRDGSKEEVKILQLPIDLIDQWAALQGDEAGLVELYCGKLDTVLPQRLRILHTQELRLLEMIASADPEKFDEIEGRLATLREKIDTLKKVERWDSKLIPESHNEILRIGEELNRPTFDRWAKDRPGSHRSNEDSERAPAVVPLTDLILDCARILGVTPREVTRLMRDDFPEQRAQAGAGSGASASAHSGRHGGHQRLRREWPRALRGAGESALTGRPLRNPRLAIGNR